MECISQNVLGEYLAEVWRGMMCLIRKAFTNAATDVFNCTHQKRTLGIGLR